jgi:molecular chaperone Hsp33
MIRSLGETEAREILAERGVIQVDCEFCGAGYRYDGIDVTQLFTQAGDRPPSSSAVQ